MTQMFAGYVSAQQDLAIASAVAETRRRDLAIQQTMDDDIRMLDETNAQITETDGRVLPLLQTLTGQDFGTDSKAWQEWWTDQLGLVVDSSSSDTKPTFTDTIATPDTTLNLPTGSIRCFPTTPVSQPARSSTPSTGRNPLNRFTWAISCLSQSTTTGELAFHPVVAVHLNKPQPTLAAHGPRRIDCRHRHSSILEGGQRVDDGPRPESRRSPADRRRRGGHRSISSDETQPVYNLDVAENRNFCVGKAGLLGARFQLRAARAGTL